MTGDRDFPLGGGGVLRAKRASAVGMAGGSDRQARPPKPLGDRGTVTRKMP
jgi:hypothetical protein